MLTSTDESVKTYLKSITDQVQCSSSLRALARLPLLGEEAYPFPL